jgi:adenylate cyclase
MKAYTRRRLAASAKLGLAAVPFAVVLRALEGGFLPGSVILGFCLGFTVGVAELFLLRNWLKGLPFLVHVVAKSVALVALMAVGYAALNVLDVVIGGDTWQEYLQTVLSRSTLTGLLAAFGVIAFLLFFVQLDRLLGPGVLLGYLTGRYHRPRREERIFMFLDLTGSTTLADEMSADRYFEFLHRSFTEMSEPILEADAHIYQYVGDEVVLTWTRRSGLDEGNCIRVFFLIEDHLRSQRERFMTEFGKFPSFRAGVHGGEVITAQIGELKREIVYNGDVLNTAARIQAQCRELDRELLVSADIVGELELDDEFSLEPLGPVPLRGKAEAVELWSVERMPAGERPSW